MNDEANVTRAQLDAAVAVATTNATAAANADRDAAVAAAVTADRDRIRAVTSLPEAAGREALALQLALTGLSADQVRASLEAVPAAAAAGRASASPIGLSAELPNPNAGTGAEASSLWDKALTSRGMKLG